MNRTPETRIEVRRDAFRRPRRILPGFANAPQQFLKHPFLHIAELLLADPGELLHSLDYPPLADSNPGFTLGTLGAAPYRRSYDKRMRVPVVFLLVITFLAPGLAQPAHVHADAAKKPTQTLPAAMIPGVGSSHLAITTSSPEAQKWFDQGLSLLHCFWDFEALRAFREAARIDPGCAMCQWGIYRAMEFAGSSEDEMKPVLDKMKELEPKATDHRAALHPQHRRKRRKGGRRSVGGLSTRAGSSDLPLSGRRGCAVVPGAFDADGFDEKDDPRSGDLYGMAILREILRNYDPDNTAADHYSVSAVEASQHPEWALESAEKLGRLTPGSGHMVHMPGHIFYRTGNYEKARQCFLDAIGVKKRRSLPARPKTDAAGRLELVRRNLSYLIANSAEEGRAEGLFDYAARLEPQAKDPAGSDNPGFYVIQIGGTRPRLAIRFGNDEAIDHPVDYGIPEDKLRSPPRRFGTGW